MILVDRLLASGVRFVLETLSRAAEAEGGDDAEALRDELLRAQMSFELGEIGEAELAEIEARVSARLRAARERERAEADEDGMRVSGVEVTLHDDVERS